MCGEDMRRFDEPIEVRHPLTGTEHGAGDVLTEPMQFIWRGRLWKVRQVQSRWKETGAWWRRADEETVDLLDEREVWRVHATSGCYGATTVAELAHASDGAWFLRGVID